MLLPDTPTTLLLRLSPTGVIFDLSAQADIHYQAHPRMSFGMATLILLPLVYGGVLLSSLLLPCP